jgi:hypothetical protein
VGPCAAAGRAALPARLTGQQRRRLLGDDWWQAPALALEEITARADLAQLLR